MGSFVFFSFPVQRSTSPLPVPIFSLLAFLLQNEDLNAELTPLIAQRQRRPALPRRRAKRRLPPRTRTPLPDARRRFLGRAEMGLAPIRLLPSWAKH